MNALLLKTGTTIGIIALILLVLILGIAATISGGLLGGVVTLLVCANIHALSRIHARFKPVEPLPPSWERWTCLALAVILGWFWLTVERNSRDPVPGPPPFASLQVTTGILQKGFGGNRTITTFDGREIEIICANKARKESTNWCLYDHERPIIGQFVTIYHDPVYRIGTAKTHYYELRHDGVRIVRYEEIAEGLIESSLRGVKTDRDLAIILSAAWLYLAVALIIRRGITRAQPGTVPSPPRPDSNTRSG